MKVGISVLTHCGQNVWENGIGQNVIHMTRLMKSLPIVSDVVLINCGDQTSMPEGRALDQLGVRLVTQRDATRLVDVAIEMSGGLDLEWIDYIRALGKKVVFHCCGHPYASLLEPSLFKRNGFFSRAERCDAVWLHEQYETFKHMLETLHRCPVFIVPYLWSPEFIERRAAEVRAHGLVFGYKNKRKTDHSGRGLRVTVFEPNISVSKACAIPMLICDMAYRRDPCSISELHLLNTEHMKDHPTFSHLTSSLDLSKDGRIFYEHRHDFVAYMSQYGDAVVTHQWRNEQNYLYLDALYGGYPLVHNSPWLGGVGYRFDNFDIISGANKLIDAYRNHAANFLSYQQSALTFLSRLHPFNSENQNRITRQLLNLSTPPRGGKGK